MFFTFAGRWGNFRFLFQGMSLSLGWVPQPCNLLRRCLQTYGNNKAASVHSHKCCLCWDCWGSSTTFFGKNTSAQMRCISWEFEAFFFLVLEKFAVLHGRSLRVFQNIYICIKLEPCWWPGGKNKCDSSVTSLHGKLANLQRRGLPFPCGHMTLLGVK